MFMLTHLFHITWEDDCLAFRFAKRKTDQTGRNSDQVCHVYATPDKPAICPVLALSTYVFANPGLTNIENFTELEGMEIPPVGFSLGGISTAVLWTASIESLGATKTNSSILVFAQAIWVHILHGRGHAVLPAQEVRCPRRWFQFACEQCGVWVPSRNATSSSKKLETSTLGEWCAALM